MTQLHLMLTRRHFEWILYLTGLCSTLLLILVYISLRNVVKQPQGVTGKPEIFHKTPAVKQIQTTILTKKLEEIENELFRIHRTVLPLRRQNEWKMNLTESLQGTHDVHKALITAGKKTKSTIATGIESVDHKSQNHAMTDQEDKQFAEDNQKPIKNGIVVTSKSNAEIEPQGRIRDNNYMKQRIVDTKHLESIKYNENVKFYSGKELLLHETDRGQQKLVQEYYNENVIKVNDIQNMNNKNFAKSAFVKPTETKNNDVLQPLPINIGKEVRTLEENATPIKTAIKAKQPPQKAKIDPPTRSMPDLDLPPTTANTEMLNTGNQMLILSYMRSGSSMNGNVFKDTEDDFYVYEPLIKFAPYHYFTENRFCMMRMSKCMKYDLEGLYVEDRIETSIRTLKNLYSCNLRGLDDRVLRSIMFENKSGKSWTDFAKCYVEVVENRAVDNLGKYLENARGKDEFERHKNVFRYLYPPGPKADKLRGCLDKLEAQCRASSIRVTKVLRLSGRLIPRLLNTFPNLKILFVLRDPRGIVNSRIETVWFPVSIDKPTEVRDNIKSLCYKMESDVHMVQIIKRDFPDRLIDYRLEDIVRNPVETFSAIFDFMNATMTDRHKNNLKNIFKAKPNFQTKWVGSLKKEFIKLTEDRCSNVFSYYRYFRMTVESDVRD